MQHAPFPDDFAAFIGIDWADTKHDICLQAAGCETREFSVLAHKPESIDEWARGLRQRFPGRPIAICLELSKGPIVYALRKVDFLVLFPINPLTLARYREAFTRVVKILQRIEPSQFTFGAAFCSIFVRHSITLRIRTPIW